MKKLSKLKNLKNIVGFAAICLLILSATIVAPQLDKQVNISTELHKITIAYTDIVHENSVNTSDGYKQYTQEAKDIVYLAYLDASEAREVYYENEDEFINYFSNLSTLSKLVEIAKNILFELIVVSVTILYVFLEWNYCKLVSKYKKKRAIAINGKKAMTTSERLYA